MSKFVEENWWNTSSNCSFNFDDDEELESSTNADDLFDFTNTTLVFGSDENNTTTLPIQSLILKGNFNLVLEDVRLPSSTSTPNVQETVLKMILGMPYNLYVYRKLNQKLELLDEAVNSYDGNVILSVLLYLEKTLKSNILLQHISQRKVALQHYSNYLINLVKLEQLADLYMVTGNVTDFIYLFFVGYNRTSNKEYIQVKLSRFLMEHETKLTRNQNFILTEYKKFIMWQLEKKMLSESIIEQLCLLCKIECENNGSSFKSVMTFKETFKIRDFQYEWTVLNAIGFMKAWKLLSTLFIKPNWLSKKNSFKSTIDPELFVVTLHKHGPPTNVLEEFLIFIDKSETALHLAKKMECHKFVIDYYASHKNKSLLWNYKQNVSFQPDDAIYAENALRSIDKK